MSTKKTIAKSFTVSTIEDGVSVQAQYAPNANPTSGQIHTVWQEGDLYMRTRESDESAWSSWHKIVGESGDETDFSFGISQYKTTANASTAPSDISSWSDAPLAVTTAKPYLWARVQKKEYQEGVPTVISTSYIRLTGEDGVSISEANVWYAVTNSSTKEPASFPYNDFPTSHLNANKYVWQATKITKSDGSAPTFTGIICLGATSDFLSGTEVYGVSDSNTQQPADWGTTYTKRKGYWLWSATRVQYSGSSQYAYLGVKCIGYWGTDGESISSANIMYFLSTSGSGTPAVGTKYDTLALALAASSNVNTQYVWQVVDVVKSDSSTHVYSGYQCLGLVKDIKSGTEVYAVSDYGDTEHTPADGSFSETYTVQNGKYLWGATKVVSGTDSTNFSIIGKVCIGYWGEDGQDAPTLRLSRTTLLYPADKDGKAVGGYWDVTVQLFVKGQQVPIADSTDIEITSITDVSATVINRTTIRLSIANNKTPSGVVKVGAGGTLNGVTYSAFAEISVEPNKKGEDGEEYEIRCPINTIKVASDESTASVTTTFSFYYKEVGKTAVAFAAHWAIYYRIGSGYSLISNSTAKTTSCSLSSYSVQDYTNAIVVFIFDSQYTGNAPTSQNYLAKFELPIMSDGNTGPQGKDAKYISITGACSVGSTQSSFSLSINDGATTTTYTTGSSVVKPDTVTGVYRGIALARVNRSTLALYGDIQVYDTYGGSVSQGISRADALAQAINSTSTDYFVILMTRDACGFTSSNSSLENAIKNCGGTKIQDTTRTRKAFAFIGINGLAQNYALQMQGEYQVGLGAKVIAYIADGMFTTARTGDDGQKGDTGKTGRFFYYAQEWANLSTVSYLVSDAQAPYFGYTNPQTNAHNYWVFNPENNGTYTMAQMGAPSSSNPNWQIMTSDFKYLITQAMFTNFAKLGSAVFSGDWMISQYGTPSRNITQEERNIVYLCVKVDGQYPVSTLATILDNDNLWDEYKDYGYTDDELEMLADVCQWAVSVMPNNTDDERYNVIQNLSNSSYQFFGINSSDKFSVFSPNVAIDYLTGKSYFNDCQIRGNLIGAVSQPFTRIKNTTIWNQYGVKTQDDYGYTRHYLFMKNMPTHKVQIEYMSGKTTEIRRLILPPITQNSLGTEIVVVNVSGDDITVEGKPDSSAYGDRGSYLLDGIQRTGDNNDTRTIVMQNQSILKFMSVEIPTQYGEYGWIAVGEPQTIKSLV